MSQKSERQDIIHRILEAAEGTTQEDIRRLLEREGIDASQSTLSRDLREMGAIKVHAGDGKAVYRLAPASPAGFTGDIIRAKNEFVLDCTEIGSFIVIKTKPGNARDFCLILDRQNWNEVVGTIAGDDTILVITRSLRDVRLVMGRLKI